MKFGTRATLSACGLGILTCGVVAHVRLRHPSNKNPLYWLNPDEISVVIAERGPDDLGDHSHRSALQLAIDAWNRVEGSTARLIEDVSPSQRARTDWQSDSVHLIYFDEDDSSGYFATGSGIVAVSPIYFFSSGRIADADVLFNGKDFHFTTASEYGHFDIADVGAHELGHLLGLNHSGWAGATMYPYVDPSILLHRSPALDDYRGLREAYPDGDQAVLTGRLERADESAVRGAHIVARAANGRPLAATLSESDGSFRLQGLDAGQYTLYASPLDGPVSAFNLGPDYTIDLDFGAGFLGAYVLESGEVQDVGTHLVAADHALSAGRVADDYPLRLVQGETRILRVRGSGLNAGCTLAASDADVELSSPLWNGSSVEFAASAPALAALGHVDLEVRDPYGALSIVTAALEITPPDPQVVAVLPASADSAGGTSLLIQGAQFRPGCRVVIGDQIYTEGVLGGATLIDGTTLGLTLAPTLGGLHDVVVIDESGVEGRLHQALLCIAQPKIASVFPSAGSVDGGTLVTLNGTGFAPGASIHIDGVPQVSVQVESAERIVLTTEAGRAGGPYELLVSNPGGTTAVSSFSFVATPDPFLAALDPAIGSVAGGDTVFVHGSNFSTQTTVTFGVDSQTGAGGQAALQVVFVDAETLRVLTPSMGSGTKSVMVHDPATDQATILNNAFTYYGSQDSGGSCFGVALGGPSDFRRIAGNCGWILALLFYALYFARQRAASPTPSASC